MGRIRRGGYIFEFWIGDHFPRHVHIFKDRRFIAKVELDNVLTVMKGRMNQRLRRILEKLVKEGALNEA